LLRGPFSPPPLGVKGKKKGEREVGRFSTFRGPRKRGRKKTLTPLSPFDGEEGKGGASRA